MFGGRREQPRHGRRWHAVGRGTVDSVPEFLILWAISTIATLIGSLVGFALGRRFGPTLRETGAKGWDRATNLFLKRSTWALFGGGMIPLIRSFVPAVAGAARIPYCAFLLRIAAGAACLSTFHLLIGAGLATALQSTAA